jgi:hypothetical protein
MTEPPDSSVMPFFLYDGEDDVPMDATHVRVDSSMTVIKAQAFFVHSNLTTAVLPTGLQIIRARAFFMCESLSHINIPFTVKIIGSGALVGCVRLQQIELPDGLESIGSAAFSSCESLSHFRVPPLIKVIESSTFANCKSLYSIELPESLERIDSRAFRNCEQLRNILISPSVNQIGVHAFEGCSSLYEVLPESHNELIEALTTRLDEYPIHKLCYYQSYYESSGSLRQELEHTINESSGDSPWDRCDTFGMTPLHLLVLSAKPNLDLCKVLVDRPAETLQIHDRWDRDPLMYCSMNLSPESTVMTKHLIKVLLSGRIESLGLSRWKREVASEIERLLVSENRQERVRHMDNVVSKLNHFLEKENLSLLELAIWKAKIDGARADIDPVEPDSNASLNPPADRAGWRTICGAADIIISNTLPFLGN